MNMMTVSDTPAMGMMTVSDTLVTALSHIDDSVRHIGERHRLRPVRQQQRAHLPWALMDTFMTVSDTLVTALSHIDDVLRTLMTVFW